MSREGRLRIRSLRPYLPRSLGRADLITTNKKSMETPIVYIAGPVSGQPDLNREAFYEADQALKAKGYFTRNPHEFCMDINSTESDDPKFYRRGIEVLTRDCTDIVMLEGWQYSDGAKIEHHVATLCRMRIHYGTKQLIDYFSNDEEG